MATSNFNVASKKNELKNILRVNDRTTVTKVYQYGDVNSWKRFALQTSDGKLIPLIIVEPKSKTSDYVLLSHPKGKAGIDASLIDEYSKKGSGVVIADLLGTGEASSEIADTLDGDVPFHTLSRSTYLLGKSVMGEWIKETGAVIGFVKEKFKAQKITLDGTKEAGLAALYYSSINQQPVSVVLRDAPVSYLFDDRESVGFFSMAIHLPGFLNWGDVSLAAALSGKNISFIHPLTMSGKELSEAQLNAYQNEFKKIRAMCHQPGITTFK